MPEARSVVTCRWARETLRLPYPHWLNAENAAWTCLRGPNPVPLDDPDICRDCPNWKSHRLQRDEES